MKRIFKYPLEIKDRQEIKLPIGFEILCVQNQQEMPYVWYLVDSHEDNTEACTIEIFGTGHEIYEDMGTERKYISTFQMRSGSLVFHAFHYTGI